MSDPGLKHDRESAEEDETSEGGADTEAGASPSSSEELHRADAFQVQRPGDDWQKGTIHTLVGPTVDGVTHNIMINTTPDIEVDSLYEFAAKGIALLEAELEGVRILVNDSIELDCGIPAYRVILLWYPSDDQRLYQEQLFVLQEDRGYTLTTTFTRETRKQLGETVERMMRSFTPTAALQEE